MSGRFHLTLNGHEVTVTAEPEMPLLYALRDLLGAREARFGCGDEMCGACAVIVDGEAVASCGTPLSAVQGKSVETAAILASDGRDHPILDELLRHQAGQCGYCLAGISMRAKALLDRRPAATRAEIAAALDANLCRCGAHARILDALEAAGRRLQAGADT